MSDLKTLKDIFNDVDTENDYSGAEVKRDQAQFKIDLISSMNTAQLLELYGFDTLKDMMSYARMHGLMPEQTKEDMQKTKEFADNFKKCLEVLNR